MWRSAQHACVCMYVYIYIYIYIHMWSNYYIPHVSNGKMALRIHSSPMYVCMYTYIYISNKLIYTTVEQQLMITTITITLN